MCLEVIQEMLQVGSASIKTSNLDLVMLYHDRSRPKAGHQFSAFCSMGIPTGLHIPIFR